MYHSPLYQILCILIITVTCHCYAISSSSSVIPAYQAPMQSVHSPHLQHARSRILMDSRIPTTTGLILAQRVGQQRPQLPVPLKRSAADERRSLEQLSPKRFFDFLTDPSLLITILHSLEVAYWTFPFGFVLTPVINFFRVPNRRSLDPGSRSGRGRRSTANEERLKMIHMRLLNSLSNSGMYGVDNGQR